MSDSHAKVSERSHSKGSVRGLNSDAPSKRGGGRPELAMRTAVAAGAGADKDEYPISTWGSTDRAPCMSQGFKRLEGELVCADAKDDASFGVHLEPMELNWCANRLCFGVSACIHSHMISIHRYC